MTISLVIAWIAVLCVILTALKFIARKSKSKVLNKAFRKIHIPLGIVLICAGLIHGVIAGNPAGTKLSDIDFCSVLFSFNAGTICFIVSVLLGIVYLFRKKLKKKWMTVHRVLTALLLVVLVIHIVDVGIQLPERLFSSSETETTTSLTSSQTEISTTEIITSETTSQPTTTTTTAPSTETTTQTTTETTTQTIIDEINDNVSFSGAVLSDGTYSGSAQGFKGNIEVTVVVENGKVTQITIGNNHETPRFLERARAVINTIINGQTLSVDAVSGATYSSNGIKNAVYNALQSAVVSGELER